MLINQIIYLLLEGFKTISRSILPSFVSSITISISLVILSVSYFFYINLYNYTSDFKNINGEQVWVDGFKRNLTKEDSPLKGQKQKGHYRTSKNGIRHYVGKKPMSLKLKELVGLA